MQLNLVNPWKIYDKSAEKMLLNVNEKGKRIVSRKNISVWKYHTTKEVIYVATVFVS